MDSLGKLGSFLSTADKAKQALDGASTAIEESRKNGIEKGVVKAGASIIPGGRYAYGAVNSLSTQNRIQEIVGSGLGAKAVYRDTNNDGEKEVIVYTRAKAFVLTTEEKE